MPFQQTVFIEQGFGVPGEIFSDVPWVVDTYTINSDGTPNIVGATAYTVTSQGFAQAGNGGGFGFAGILGIPKSYALFGTTNQPLAPTLILPDFTQAEIVLEGRMIVTLPAAADIADYVIYDNTTGALATMSPGPTLPSGFSFANATVVLFQQDIDGTGLAVIQLDPVINPIPTTGV